VNSAAIKTLIIYAIILPLAVFIGWIVSGDLTRTSFALLAMIVFVLLIPVLLKFHYPVLVFSWQTPITIFFLPGQPTLWMLMAGVNFGIAVLNRIILKKPAFLPARSVTMSLLALAAVVVITAKLRGGIGLAALGGSTFGGKGYVWIFGAIIGYFALASQPIPIERAKFYVGLFFLSTAVMAGSHFIYFLGPAFYPLFLLFPIGVAQVQAATEHSYVSRLAGFAAIAPPLIYYLCARFGLREVLSKWWRLLLVVCLLALGTLGGYRSTVVQVALTLAILFVVEGLLRSSLFPLSILVALLGFAGLAIFSEQLPKSIQRSISFLPVKIDPFVARDAQGSLEWRFFMWKAMLPDLPKYIWLGKGYSINPTDMYLVDQAVRRGRASDWEGAIIAGDYHSGPLSLYVPFGSFGVLAFLAFLVTSLRALYRNYRYGPVELKTINGLLFSSFFGQLIFFFGAFGAFNGGLYIFTGTIGLSVALNHGICTERVAAASLPVRFRRNFPLRSARAGIT
jgi:hypothetical protein